MLHPFERIPATSGKENVVHAIIEISKGRRNKFEMDKATGLIKLDRYLYASSHYPGDYGFVPQTLAEDHDPLDVIVMVNEPTFPGCLIEARIIGLFKMIDRGEPDYKLLGVPESDPFFKEFRDLPDVPEHFLKEVEHFFLTYKQLEGAEIQSEGWLDAEAGKEEVRLSMKRYREKEGGWQ